MCPACCLIDRPRTREDRAAYSRYRHSPEGCRYNWPGALADVRRRGPGNNGASPTVASFRRTGHRPGRVSRSGRCPFYRRPEPELSYRRHELVRLQTYGPQPASTRFMDMAAEPIASAPVDRLIGTPSDAKRSTWRLRGMCWPNLSLRIIAKRLGHAQPLGMTWKGAGA